MKTIEWRTDFCDEFKSSIQDKIQKLRIKIDQSKDIAEDQWDHMKEELSDTYKMIKEKIK